MHHIKQEKLAINKKKYQITSQNNVPFPHSYKVGGDYNFFSCLVIYQQE